MLAHVGDEGTRLGEGFPADQALARLLSWGRQGKKARVGINKPGMGSIPPPLLKIPRGEKVEGGQSCVPTGVDADVSLQRSRVGELALAVDADVGFFAAVDPEVAFQIA